MPRPLDPTTQLELVLGCDRDTPNPPTFLAPTLTARQWLEFAKLYDEIFDQPTNAEQLAKALALLGQYIVGWRDMPVGSGDGEPRPADLLGDVLTAGEVMELVHELYVQTRLGYDDKKKSGSPPSSNAASSAATAAAAAASTPPPN